VGNTLNVPQYTGGGTVTNVDALTIGTSGSDINSTVANATTTPVITLNIPDASATVRGVVTNGAQSFGGVKTFSSTPTFSTMTAGSLLFAGTSGALNQNNANLFWDNTNARLGIGTTTPSQTLHVNSSVYTSALFEAPIDNIVTISSKLYTARSVLSLSGLGGWGAYNIVQQSGATSTSSTLNFNHSGNLNTSASVMFFDASNQVGINTITPSARLNVVGTTKLEGQTTINGSTTASGAIAQGVIVSPTLNAAASNDVLVGLDINPTFSNPGAYSGVRYIGLRVQDINIGRGGGGFATNTAFGSDALLKNTVDGANSAFGHQTLYYNTTGTYNIAFGYRALYGNTNGTSNNAFGVSGLTALTSGSSNNSFGHFTLSTVTTASNNTAFGHSAGRWFGGNYTTNNLNTSTGGIFIGYYASPLADASTNEIVIGYSATGLGNNSTVIGNSSTTKAKIFGTLQTQGNKLAIAAKTGAYAILTSDQIVTGDATSAAFTITLPTAVSKDGQTFTIKKIDASGNAVTVGTTSSQTIDGSTTYSLPTQYKYVTVVSDGANWIIVGGN